MLSEISALILAAGEGRRMGIPKIFSRLKEKSFHEIISENLLYSGIYNIITVIKREYEDEFKNLNKGNYIINNFSEKGMMSSVQTGINYLKNEAGVLIFPVDFPFVKKETLMLIKKSFDKNRECIIKPVYAGVSGHPVIVPQIFFRLITGGKFSDLNSALKSETDKTIFVNTNDEGIVRNINYPEDI